MKEIKILYTGLFVDDTQSLLGVFPPKYEVKYAHHSTIEFKPLTLEKIELGKKNKIKILGRVFDDKCDVLLVENPKSKNKFPHITLSCASGVSPVYSNKLLEEASKEGKIDYSINQIEIDSTEGYSDGLKIYFS